MTNNFLQREISVTSNELLFATINKGILQQVTSEFLQRATCATSNKNILQRVKCEYLQRVTSDFTTSNKQRVNFNE